MSTTKIELSFDRKSLPPDNDIQFYRIYRKKNAIPDRLRSELAFIIAQPSTPENQEDTIVRVDSQLAQTGVSYDPLEQISEIDPRGSIYKIAIDDSSPIPATNLMAMPDLLDNQSDIGGIFIQWTPAASIGTTWGYDVTAIDSEGLESLEGAELLQSNTSKLETIDIGLADGETPVPSEYPLAGQVFNRYMVTSSRSYSTVSNQNSVLDNNNGLGWDTDGPSNVNNQVAISDFANKNLILKWSESLKTLGTDLSSIKYRVTSFSVAGYSSTSIEVSGPNNVICPITNGIAGVSLTKIDATRWHDGVTLKTAAPPPPVIALAPATLDGIIYVAHGSIILGSALISDATGQMFYVEDSGKFNFPNGDGDYIVDYSMINGTTDVGGRIKILSTGIIRPGQQLNITYKFGVDYGTFTHSLRPTILDSIVGIFDGTVWSGTGPQTFTDSNVDLNSAYNYAWFVTDNAGRTSQQIKYAQGILQDIVFPTNVTNLSVEAVLTP